MGAGCQLHKRHAVAMLEAMKMLSMQPRAALIYDLILDRERSIFGDRARGAKISRSGGEGECVKNVSHGLPWRLKETLHAWRVGAVERGTEKSSQSRPFLLPFHRYIDSRV
jgi:hypothetical protein